MKTLQERLRDAANTGISDALEAADKLDELEKQNDELRAKLQSPKVAPTVAIDERAEFEKWANKHNGGEPLQLGGGGTYTNPFANAAYEAWQAARKLSAPEVAPTTVAEVVSKTTDTIVPDAKDEIDHDGIWTNSDVAEQRYIQGWNDCRAAMLKGEK